MTADATDRERLAEVLAAITDPIHAGGCHYRHQQGETDECNSCTAHRIETAAVDALAGMLAEARAEARAEALREAADALDERAARVAAEDPFSTPDGYAYFQGQSIALRANAIRLRDRAALTAEETP